MTYNIRVCVTVATFFAEGGLSVIRERDCEQIVLSSLPLINCAFSGEYLSPASHVSRDVEP